MTERETPNIGGYEWGFQCECGEFLELSGRMGATPKNLGIRTWTLYDGDEIECPECDRTTTLRLEVSHD